MKWEKGTTQELINHCAVLHMEERYVIGMGTIFVPSLVNTKTTIFEY